MIKYDYMYSHCFSLFSYSYYLYFNLKSILLLWLFTQSNLYLIIFIFDSVLLYVANTPTLFLYCSRIWDYSKDNFVHVEGEWGRWIGGLMLSLLMSLSLSLLFFTFICALLCIALFFIFTVFISWIWSDIHQCLPALLFLFIL